MTRHSLHITALMAIVATALALALAACSSDEPSSALPGQTVYDFATLAESSKQGSTFTLRKSDDSELIEYTSKISFDDIADVNTGDRLIIAYNRDGGATYTSGPIKLYGYRLLDCTSQRIEYVDPDSMNNWKSEPVKIVSLTRTGTYLNFNLSVTCTQAVAPTRLVLALDQDDAEAESPVLHIVYDTPSPGLNLATAYASVDIADVWLNPDCQGVTIAYTAPDGTTRHITIDK